MGLYEKRRKNKTHNKVYAKTNEKEKKNQEGVKGKCKEILLNFFFEEKIFSFHLN